MDNLTTVPSKGFTYAVKDGLKRLTDVKDRTRRADFWWYVLAYCIASFVVSWFAGVFLPATVVPFVDVVLSLLLIAITIRRLHDTGKSGWWVIVCWVANLIMQIYVVKMMNDGVLDSGNTEELMTSFTDPVLLTVGAVGGIISIVIFIFTLLDSKVEDNKYGKSPKYVKWENGFGE